MSGTSANFASTPHHLRNRYNLKPSGPSTGFEIGSNGNTQITGSQFIANWGAVGVDGSALGAGVSSYEGTTLISECIFVNNRVAARDALGAAVYGNGTADIQVERCTIVGNVARDREGATRGCAGVFFERAGRVSHSIIAFNEGSACCGSGVYTCNVLFGNTLGEWICGQDGGGNVFLDPQFCATDPAASMNFLLQNDSPCTTENSGGCGLIGAAPVGCTSVHVEPRTWSQVKNMFRR